MNYKIIHKYIWHIALSIILITLIGICIDAGISRYKYWQSRNIELPHSTFAPVDDELNERLIQQCEDFGKKAYSTLAIADKYYYESKGE